VGDIVALGQNFETNENLGGLAESKSSKIEILDIRGSLMGEK
jgi:hypothetical protein